MANCTFVFDVIVTHVATSKANIENTEKLKIEFTLNKQTLVLSSSRINVKDFPPGRGTEFRITPKQLRQNLEQCGMPLVVKYDDIILGSGQMCFPQTIVNSIDEGMRDQIFTDACNFQREGQDIGKVEILCRLFIKCEEQPKGESNCRRNMGSQIIPQDILFIVSESQRSPRSCDPCVDVWKQEKGDDLQRYRSNDIGAVRPAEMLVESPVLDEVKNMKNECVDLMDSLLRRSGLNSPRQNHVEESPLKPSSAPYNSFPSDVHKEKAEICSPSRRVSPTSASYQSKIKPIRFCPRCLSNMSWLPKFACCPYCGLKPMPSIGKPREKRMLEKPPNMLDDYSVLTCTSLVEKKDSVRTNKCRCTCKFGKPCAYCRVRAECAEFFKSEEKQETEKTELSHEPTTSEACFRKEKSQQSRPFLACVFSELCLMHELNIKQPIEENELGNQRLSIKRTSRRSNDSSISKNRKSSVVEESRKQIKPDAVEHFPQKPLKIKPTKIIARHKDCVVHQRAVSPRHGWAWSTTQEAREKGWRPGVVSKPIKRLMSYFLENSPENNAQNIYKRMKDEEKEMESQKPILNVCKKNGEIHITLRAVNTPSIEMKPIVFKLVKSDLAVAMTEIKKKLKDKGFRKCCCHQPLKMCVCRDKSEKEILESAVEKESRQRGIDNCVDQLVFTDSTESDMEFDFDVPSPVGIKKPPMPSKAITINTCTQTAKKDQKVEPIYPIAAKPYWKPFDCAGSNRYLLYYKSTAAAGKPKKDSIKPGFGKKKTGSSQINAKPRNPTSPMPKKQAKPK